MTPPSSDFHHYKQVYDRLMDAHKSLQSEYQSAKAQHEAARAEFDQAKQECDAVKAILDQAIEAERAKWHDKRCQECGTTIRVNIEWSHPPKYCKSCKEKFVQKQMEKAAKEAEIARQAGLTRLDDVKVVFKPSRGKNEIYFNGYGEAAGPSHGHAVVDDHGDLHFLRDENGNVIKDDGIRL